MTDFNLEPSACRVQFQRYYYCQISGKKTTFKSTFLFSVTGFYVRVTAEERWVSRSGTEKIFWESCFQKPDPTGWQKNWDDQFHQPPFIQSTEDFLNREVWE